MVGARLQNLSHRTDVMQGRYVDHVPSTFIVFNSSNCHSSIFIQTLANLQSRYTGLVSLVYRVQVALIGSAGVEQCNGTIFLKATGQNFHIVRCVFLSALKIQMTDSC